MVINGGTTFVLNDAELYEAFKKLGANQELVNIEIDPQLPKQKTKVRLSSGKESIELKKYTMDEK